MNKMIINVVSVPVIIGLSVLGFAVFSGNNETNQGYQDTIVENITDEQEQELKIESENSDNTRIMDNAVNPEKVTKDDIFHMMLNSIDYYDKVSGTMLFSSDNADVVNVVEFQSNLSEAASYTDYKQCSVDSGMISSDRNTVSVDSLSSCLFENVIFCDNNQKISLLSDNKTYEYQNDQITYLEDVIKISDEERISVADDGLPLYRFRADPTNVLMSSMCIFPQDMAFGFLENQDLWDIVDIVDYEDKSCYLIKGKTTYDYGLKLNVSSFEFLVDTNTGVLVKYEGFDESGNLSDFMYTENLKFENNAESVQMFSDNLIEGYTDLTDR